MPPAASSEWSDSGGDPIYTPPTDAPPSPSRSEVLEVISEVGTRPDGELPDRVARPANTSKSTYKPCRDPWVSVLFAQKYLHSSKNKGEKKPKTLTQQEMKLLKAKMREDRKIELGLNASSAISLDQPVRNGNDSGLNNCASDLPKDASDTQSDPMHCTICDFTIRTHLWASHKKSKPHIKKARRLRKKEQKRNKKTAKCNKNKAGALAYDCAGNGASDSIAEFVDTFDDATAVYNGPSPRDDPFGGCRAASDVLASSEHNAVGYASKTASSNLESSFPDQPRDAEPLSKLCTSRDCNFCPNEPVELLDSKKHRNNEKVPFCSHEQNFVPAGSHCGNSITDRDGWSDFNDGVVADDASDCPCDVCGWNCCNQSHGSYWGFRLCESRVLTYLRSVRSQDGIGNDRILESPRPTANEEHNVEWSHMYCNICDRDILANDWGSHVSGTGYHKQEEQHKKAQEAEQKQDTKGAKRAAGTWECPDDCDWDEGERPASTISDKVAGGEKTQYLVVSNLNWNVDEDWLSSMFVPYGVVKSCRINTDRMTGRSKGSGYVEFSTFKAAKAAKEALHDSELDGRAMIVDFSPPRPQPTFDKDDVLEYSFSDRSLSPSPSALWSAGKSAEPPVSDDLVVTYWITVESGDRKIHIPIEPEEVTGQEKDIVNGGMKKVWKWIQDKKAEDKIGLQDAFDLAQELHDGTKNGGGLDKKNRNDKKASVRDDCDNFCGAVGDLTDPDLDPRCNFNSRTATDKRGCDNSDWGHRAWDNRPLGKNYGSGKKFDKAKHARTDAGCSLTGSTDEASVGSDTSWEV